MSLITLIQSDEEHRLAMSRLMSLMDATSSDTDFDAQEIDSLARAIEIYEQENYPIDPPEKSEAILFRLDQEDVGKND